MTGESRIVSGAALPLGRYPHVRIAGGFAFVSGTSSRLPDGSIAGADVDERGEVALDVRTQTRVVIEKIAAILSDVGAGLGDLVSVTAYLIDMADFDGYNEVYGTYFGDDAPARTTVAVHQLPHPHLLVEMQAVAVLPSMEVDR